MNPALAVRIEEDSFREIERERGSGVGFHIGVGAQSGNDVFAAKRRHRERI